MCGFVGLFRRGGLTPEDPERTRRAAASLAHRGPDSEGHWHDSHLALGFRRLKVLDLSPAGEQPMTNEDRRLQVVFNGEIYNFLELRRTLETSGHVFRSRTDTEVLLHGYEEWGAAGLLERLRGMFAFALWDCDERRLLLARDPLGVKPLYFAERGDAVLFASEPKALFATGLVEAQLDPVALHEALTCRYVSAPRSGFRDVEKLPPGCLATANDESLSYLPWWHGPGGPSAEYSPAGHRARRQAGALGAAPPGYADWLTDLVDGHLGAAVQRRLRSDVPLGMWLSGGLDSGLVTALAAQAGPVRAFCAGFAQPEYDERPLAAASARHLKQECAAFETPADVFRFLPQIVWHADEPFFDSSCLPAFSLAAETKRHATVVLSGDGGDEIFAGYERYVGLRQLRWWQRLPGGVRAALLWAARRRGAHSRQGWDRALLWLEHCRETARHGLHPYLAAMSLFEQDEIRALYGERLAEENAELDGREHLSHALLRATKDLYPDQPPKTFRTDAGVLQRADLATYLPGDVLHKVDRMSMAHGLEVRSPFLDVDLVRFALALPEQARLPGRETKPLLRRLAARRLPREVARGRKRGFGVPLDDWFRGPLKETARGIFESSHLVAAGLFRPRYWDAFWEPHQARRAQHGERLYALLALELWHRTFLEGTVPTERPATLF